MREIKFRAWDKKHKIMFEYADIDTKGLCVMSAYSSDGDNYEYQNGKYQPKIDLIPMQYTGLKDKKGKEIYEGDIVELSIQLKTRVKKLNVLVEWKKELAGFVPRTLYKKHWEILGNVYENKEMVELLTN